MDKLVGGDPAGSCTDGGSCEVRLCTWETAARKWEARALLDGGEGLLVVLL